MKIKITFPFKVVMIITRLLVVCILHTNSTLSWGQNNSKKNYNDCSFLEGKIFTVNINTFDENGKITGNSTPDELAFLNGKFYSRKIGRENNYTSDSYSCHPDSSKGAGAISFVAFSKNESGGIEIFWKGTISGNTIKGTMHWFAHGKTKMFSGSLKYESEEK